MTQLYFLLVTISFLACLFLAWFFSHRAKYEERKMLIQKGLSMEEISKNDKAFKFPWFKVGMIIVGLSVGLGIIVLLVNLGLTGRSDAIYPAILGLCGGTSLLLANFIDRRGKQR